MGRPHFTFKRTGQDATAAEIEKIIPTGDMTPTEKQLYVAHVVLCVNTHDKLTIALREIKKTCLTATDGPKALAHIIRLCIDAGVTEKLDAL